MGLTYDQRSEIRMAFNEAYVPADRRRELRIKHRVPAEICAWERSRQGTPFRVQIEDFSPSGVGMIHTRPLQVGSEYLIKVPRPSMDELVVLLSVVRSVPTGEGDFHIGLELSSVMDRPCMSELVDAISARQRVTSRRTKVLLLLFGIVGIGTSLLIQ